MSANWQEALSAATSTAAWTLREFPGLRQVTLDKCARRFLIADHAMQRAVVAVYELGSLLATRSFIEEYTDRCVVNAVYGAMLVEPHGGPLTDSAVAVVNYYTLSRYDNVSDPKVKARELPFLAGPREQIQEALDVVRSVLRL